MRLGSDALVELEGSSRESVEAVLRGSGQGQRGLDAAGSDDAERLTHLIADNRVQHDALRELVRLAAADDGNTLLLKHHGDHCSARS